VHWPEGTTGLLTRTLSKQKITYRLMECGIARVAGGASAIESF
jgi:hypothetical protein